MKKWILFTYVLRLFLTFPVNLPAQIVEGNYPSNSSLPLPGGTNKLAEAITLYNAGKPADAKTLLATIPKNDPAYLIAQRYRALCLYDLKDYHGFMKALDSFDIKAAVVPVETLETLAFDQIDGLFFFRKFEDIFPAIHSFQVEHATSARLTAVKDYQLGALFERGLKKTLEACRLNDETEFNRRWTEGRGNLEQFLSLARETSLNDYSVLTNRSIREDVWAARLILGDGMAVLEEIPGQDAANREKFSLLRVLLYPKLQPNSTDANLQKMSDFLKDFPQSRNGPKVRFEMAKVALVEGERIVAEARRTADARAADAKKASAATYLNMARSIFSGVVEDKEAGIGASELRESREGILRVFYAKGDWQNLSDWVSQMLSNSPDEKEWLVIKVYAGAGLVRQQRLDEAAKVLDETLAIGFRNTPSYDGLLVAAAGWRISVAKQADDDATIRQMLERVQNSNCTDSIKRTFMSRFGYLVTQPSPASK